MKVIGFSGKKQSGKSTAVHDIIRRVEKASGRVAELPFAAYLKKLLSDTLGIDPALFETEA